MQAEIDGKLLEEVRALAEKQGLSEREVLDEAVRRHLERSRAGGLGELFEEAARWQRERGIEPPSDEEAMRLANEELHSVRRGRKAER